MHFPYRAWCLLASSGLAAGAPGLSLAQAPGPQPLPSTSYSTARHDQEIAAWRAGRLPHALLLQQLERWLSASAEASERQRLQSDLVVVAQQAGDAARAVSVGRAASPDALRPYALPALIAAARSTGDTGLQAAAVRRLLLLQPDSWEARVQEALLRIDQQDFDAAGRRIATLAAEAGSDSGAATDRRVAVRELRGALAEAQGLPIEALHQYQEVLALQLDHGHALRSESLLLAQAGAPSAALATAESRPGLHDALERAGLQQAALGERLRWALSERDLLQLASTRFAALDQVIAEGEQLASAFAAAAAQADATDAAAWHRIRQRLDADRVVALFQRGRYREALALYGALEAAPYHAKAAAAGAHAQLRRPDLAIPLYEAARREGADAARMPSDVHVGLVYAYIDTARFAQAQALIDEMIARTPPLLALSPVAGKPNDDYADLQGLRALVALYTDRPAQAERAFARLAGKAPMNASYGIGQALTQRARERPRAAQALFQEVLADHPDSLQARAGLAETLFDNGELGEARRRVAELEQLDPGHAAVRSAVRTRDDVMAPRLEVDAGVGRAGGTLANRDAFIETRLYAGWSDAGLRFFHHQWLGTADLGAQDARHARGGIGVQLQRGPWRWATELHQSSGGGRRTGVAVDGEWRASDAWLLSGRIDSNAIDLPWRARQAGVSGGEAQVAASFIANESRRVTGEARVLDLSDGNRRQSLGVAWRERWLSGPRWQVETTLAADTARHRTQAVPYFSPDRESAAALTARTQVLTWKRDDASLLQVVEAGAGRYRQQGFGTGATTVLRYAHAWRWGAGKELRYGVGTSTHPYDGVRERRRDLFLHFSMPFQ